MTVNASFKLIQKGYLGSTKITYYAEGWSQIELINLCDKILKQNGVIRVTMYALTMGNEYKLYDTSIYNK